MTEEFSEAKSNNKALNFELTQKDKIIKKTLAENEILNRNFRSTQVELKETKVLFSFFN